MAMEKNSVFDGCIFTFYPVVLSIEQLQSEIGIGIGEYCVILCNGHVEEWRDPKKFREATEIIWKRQKKDPDYLARLIRLWEDKKAHYVRCVEEIERTPLEKRSNEELVSRLNSFLHAYIDQYALPILTFVYREPLSEFLMERLSKKTDNVGELLSFITLPEKELFVNEERIQMLELMGRMADRFGLPLFDRPVEEIENELRQNAPALYEQLVEHTREYFWMDTNYRRARLLGPLDFLRKMKEEKQVFRHPREELERIRKRKMELLKKKKERMPLLDEEERRAAYLISEGAWWEDQRKKYNMIANYVLFRFLNEVSRRMGIDTELISQAHGHEIPLLLDGEFDLAILEKRRNSVFSMYFRKEEGTIEIGATEGRRYIEQIPAQTEELRGTPASAGRASGNAVIIRNEKEFDKMKEGAVLVTVMTRPEFISVMRKACAIVTDEGGLTCHAAILAREFGIPCVVGTRVATAILKDGDRIEVTGDRGEIKILKRGGVV